MSILNIKISQNKRSAIILMISVLVSLFIIIFFSNKSKLMIESMAVSPDEQYIAYFITGDGYRICCVCADGTSTFTYDIPTDISAGGFCSLWFDDSSLYALFYRTDKLIRWALDGTILNISKSINDEYPPEFPLFTHKWCKYVFHGKKINVVYDEQSFWGYWVLGKERYVAIVSKNKETRTICAWTARDGIIVS